MSLFEQVRELPRTRHRDDVTPIAPIMVDKNTVKALKLSAAENGVAMGRLAELAISRLLSELASQASEQVRGEIAA